MKIVFVSNFYNHHQAPLSNELYEKTNGNYWFIETVPMDDERLKLGWNNRNLPHFVKKSYLSDEEYQLCKSLILHADIVITGSAPNSILKERLISKKIVLRYSERIYKNKKQYLTFPVRLFKYHIQDYKSKNVYMLCSSAYAKIDYNLTLNYIGKCFKYGYFPECLSYDDIDTIVSEKDHNSIIWVGRFIEWKHPEVPVHVAKLLKSKGITFNLTLIGEGPLKTKIQSMVIKENLADCVSVIGPMEPSNVRKHMEKAQVFLFTSDRGEGWGAVLNEAMNSGCVSIVNKEIGSAPFLIKNNFNGFLIKKNNVGEICSKIRFLFENKEAIKSLSKEAYLTIKSLWNAKIVSERLLVFAQALLENRDPRGIFESGPFSKA